MALDWQNPNYFLNQSYPFHQFHFQDPNNILSPPTETELLCFDPLPPSLFDFDEPLFDPIPLQQLDFNYDCNIHNCNNNFSPFSYVDFQPPVIVPAEEILSFEDNDYYPSQFTTPFYKKQRVSAHLPCFNESYIPEALAVPEYSVDYVNDNFNNSHNYGYCCNGNEGGANFNEGCGSNGNKAKAVSAQSKAARERRRKITEKTQELGKLIPGGNKMNTAEMFQAAAKYVKFMQAQMGILQSIKTLQQVIFDNDKKANLSNLPILSSSIVQEKLYAKEQCLVPLELLPILEEHCDDYEADPSIKQQIEDLLH
ncbi:transcription factor bHLH52-like [Chenopodium quinoa]|uniref:transcription factor bHLH52-like n=1 Tax=Chenopodium quinoa TaxID=63459 RepID=UPI000B776C0A|nr:transcription factor bHLH52-like [Chenopodium quinoa]